MASVYTSVYPVVRTKLVELQRQLAEHERCHHGWKRYRNCRASECKCKDLSYRKLLQHVQKEDMMNLPQKGVDCDMKEIEQDIIEP